MWERIRVISSDGSTGTLSRLLIPDPSDPHSDDLKQCKKWTEVNDPDDIYHHVLEQNHNQILRAGPTPFGDGYMSHLIDDVNNTFIDDILDGTADIDSLTDDELMRKWLRNLRHTSESAGAEPISLDISMEDYRRLYRTIREEKILT